MLKQNYTCTCLNCNVWGWLCSVKPPKYYIKRKPNDCVVCGPYSMSWVASSATQDLTLSVVQLGSQRSFLSGFWKTYYMVKKAYNMAKKHTKCDHVICIYIAYVTYQMLYNLMLVVWYIMWSANGILYPWELDVFGSCWWQFDSCHSYYYIHTIKKRVKLWQLKSRFPHV